MSYAEDILKLRKRVQDAVSKGVVTDDGKDFLEASLIQIMNDAERNRQNCLTQADNLRRQAAQFDGQAGAFASVSSIVYNVINGFVIVAERDEEERAAEAAEKAEVESDEKSSTVKKRKSSKKPFNQ
jgi:CHASE3 domain sensor protein